MQCVNATIPAHTKGDQPKECESCIDYLNWCRLMTEPKTDSIASNQTVAMNYLNKFIHEYSMQEVFMFQKRFEALAAQCSLIYNERLIKDKIPNPKDIERKQEDWNRAVKEQKDAQRPAKERKILSDRDKAIQAYVNVGISKNEAIAIVDKQMAEIGRIAK